MTDTRLPNELQAPVKICRLFAIVSLPLLAALNAGCSGVVKVESQFPAPLIEPLPLQVAVHYPPALSSYTYKEEADSEKDWTIELGAANVAMFDSVLGALFPGLQHVTAVAAAKAEMPEVQLVLSPVVDTFEFSLPSQSATDQYAVWIRYNLGLYTSDGRLISQWPVAAYGQSGASGLTGATSMQRATILALRDAAATVATSLPQQAAIRDLLDDGRVDESRLEQAPVEQSGVDENTATQEALDESLPDQPAVNENRNENDESATDEP